MIAARLGVPLVVVALVGGGCAWIATEVPSSERTAVPTEPTPAVTADPALAANLPAEIADAGVLNFVTDPAYAPMEFTVGDNLTIVGADVDLGNAIAASMGLRATWTAVTFSQVLPRVEDGSFDAALSALTITPERRNDAEMVSYLRTGLLWAVRRGNPDGITPDDACGHTVAVQRSTVQAADVEERSAQCTAAGRPAITIEFFAVQSAATAALLAGSVQAMLADTAIVSHAVRNDPDVIERAGEPYDEALLGIAVATSEPGLAKAIQQALQELMDDGSYAQILQRWGLGEEAVDTAERNPDPAQASAR